MGTVVSTVVLVTLILVVSSLVAAAFGVRRLGIQDSIWHLALWFVFVAPYSLPCRLVRSSGRSRSQLAAVLSSKRQNIRLKL